MIDVERELSAEKLEQIYANDPMFLENNARIIGRPLAELQATMSNLEIKQLADMTADFGGTHVGC